MTNTPPPPHTLNTLNHQQEQQNQIAVPISLALNLPCGQLIEGNKEDYIKFCVPLFEASIKGDWNSAKAILDERPELIRFAITKNYETPLHIAVSEDSIPSRKAFVVNLVSLMEKKDLELQNKSYNTALSLAAAAGNVDMATIFVEKNQALLEIPGNQGMMPLYVAASFERAKMVGYLYNMSNNISNEYWTSEKQGCLLLKCVEAEIYGVAVRIVIDCTRLTSNKKLLGDVLLLLAQKTDVFNNIHPEKSIKSISPLCSFYMIWQAISERRWDDADQLVARANAEFYGPNIWKAENKRKRDDAIQLLEIIWNKIAIMPNNEIDEILQGPPLEVEEEQYKKITYPSRVLFVAAKMGNLRFIIQLIHSYPDLMWTVDDNELTIFHVGIKHRQEHIYSLLYEIGWMKESITSIEDKNGNNMLHLVAKSFTLLQDESQRALLMQRELLWYKEVEQMIPPAYREKKNREGETPKDIFKKTHGILRAESERWIKETAPQCLVGATLIATIGFAAAFTVPGGYNQNTGIPIFQHKPAFLVFVMADVISLMSSSASILVLLSFFTCRYAQSDFFLLPSRLMLSLATLYISIAAMMVAFIASFFLLYNKNLKWIPICVCYIASLSASLIVITQFPLLTEIFRTYSVGFLSNPTKRVLYYKKSV